MTVIPSAGTAGIVVPFPSARIVRRLPQPRIHPSLAAACFRKFAADMPLGLRLVAINHQPEAYACSR